MSTGRRSQNGQLFIILIISAAKGKIRGVQVICRILADTVQTDLEVTVVAGGISGRADKSYELSPVYLLIG